MSLNPLDLPYIKKNILIRRYDEVEVFDLEENDSFELDDEALSVLKFVEDNLTNKEIKEKYPQEKQEEVRDALIQFSELGILKFRNQDTIVPYPYNFKVSDIPELNPFEMPYLRALMINLTEKCNLRCDHCYIVDKHQTDFPLNKLKNIINEFYNLQGLKLVFTGGEPFIYSELVDLLKFLQKIPLQKIILSNAVLVENNPEIVNLMKENIHEVYVSIDGLKDTHNTIRKADCFDKTIRGIKILQENGIKVSINTMVHKLNIGEFDKLQEFIKQLAPISSWILDIPTFDDSIPSEIREKYKITPDEAKGIFGVYGWGSGFEFEAGNLACGPGIMAIDVLGKVTKCGFFTDMSVGNIHNLGVKNAWQLTQKNLNWCLDDLKCQEIGCEYLQNCRGGCRYRAYINTGELLGIDKFRCIQFEKD